MSPKQTPKHPKATTADVSPLTVVALCDALHVAGITLTASRDGLFAAPRSGITPDMAEAIRAHKASLVRALDRLGPVTPFPCSYCALDFVSLAGQHCGTCATLVGQPLRVDPDSTEERLLLRAIERRQTPENCGHPSQLVPQSGTWDGLGRVGNVA